jgi:acyl-CoA synthetase (AMP-forming)/AMP-acid ligase II
MLNDSEKLAAIQTAYPAEGLFAEKDWLKSPEPFAIDRGFEKELVQLGHQLFVFQRACNQLYQLSAKGKQPAWVARYLDAGKPAELIEFSRKKEFRDALPRNATGKVQKFVLRDKEWKDKGKRIN